MIIDTVDHLAHYRCLSPLIDLAAAFLRDQAEHAADGRYDLSGDDAFALVQTYTPQPATSRRWEAHQAYVDIQVILSGREHIGYAPLASLTLAEPYHAARDVTWLTGEGSFIHMMPAMFMILAPHDAHMPGIAVQAPAAAVRKVVFKLAAASFTPHPGVA